MRGALGPLAEQLRRQGRHLVHGLGRDGWGLHPALHLLIGGRQRRGLGHGGHGGHLVDAVCRWWLRGAVGRAGWQELQAVGGGQAVVAMQGAAPPAQAARHVLLQHRQDVPPAERQLVRALGLVVVERLGQAVLGTRSTRTLSQPRSALLLPPCQDPLPTSSSV